MPPKRGEGAAKGKPKPTLSYTRFIRDMAGTHSSSGYENVQQLHDVFDQMGAKIVRLSPLKYIVIQHDEVLIYERRPQS